RRGLGRWRWRRSGRHGEPAWLSPEMKKAAWKEAALRLPRVQRNFGKWNFGGTPMRLLISHCWAIDKVLLVIQYITRPAGKKKNITEKISGMNHISLACIGSGGAGFSAVCSKLVNVITTGRMKNGSGDDKS